MSAQPEAERRWLRAAALIGLGVENVDTPALVIDLDAMERNLDRIAAFASARALRLRPHAKTHKSAELAQAQMARGAVGVCVQKIDEALALARAGVADIFISNEVIDPAKLRRLSEALRTLPTRFAIAVDSALGLERLAQALLEAGVTTPLSIDVFIEIDVGQGRCGLPPGAPAVALAQRLLTQPALRFAGLQAYHGGAQHLRSANERTGALHASAQAVRQTLDALAQAGISTPLVTGAGSGTFSIEAASGLWGELQCGSYLFMDADYAQNQTDPGAPEFEHALFIKAQVMSRGQDHAVIDAGHKSHALDSGPPAVAWPHDLAWANGGDEHGLLSAATPRARLPALGETVWLIPGHCDPTVNLHDFYVGLRGGLQEGRVERLIRIDARGALG
jgi:D-serine deaminase-like pyridoxal phosphate-dependent protein